MKPPGIIARKKCRVVLISDFVTLTDRVSSPFFQWLKGSQTRSSGDFQLLHETAQNRPEAISPDLGSVFPVLAIFIHYLPFIITLLFLHTICVTLYKRKAASITERSKGETAMPTISTVPVQGRPVRDTPAAAAPRTRKRIWAENALVFLFGGFVYCGIEVVFRGFTHWSMGVTGGACLVLIYRFRLRHPEKSLWKKCLVSSGIITTLEFLAGIIVNLILHWNVWDYSSVPMNLLGQICLPFSIMWCVLSIPALGICRWFQEKVFSPSAASRSSLPG